jgi:hypothetical protein
MVIQLTDAEFVERLKILCAGTKTEDRLSVKNANGQSIDSKNCIGVRFGYINYPGVVITFKKSPGSLDVLVVSRDGAVSASKVRDRISEWFGEE